MLTYDYSKKTCLYVCKKVYYILILLFSSIYLCHANTYFKNVNSKEAQKALQIYAEELEGITGMIAIQYFPYELGKQIFWNKNKAGLSIPTIAADFSLWNEVNASRPHCGTPEYIASLINRDALSNTFGSNYSWTIVHAWSDFRKTSKISKKPAV